MHYVQAKGILSSKNGMNLYRGCTHGCIYCDSRSTCYQMTHDFEDIEVKENALELLQKTLLHKRKKGMIGCGSMCDPYIPLETQLNYTRRAMQLAYDHGFGFTLITKSDLILRDLDMIEKLHKKTRCVVQMTLTTHDDVLCKLLEPNVCTTKKRVEVLMKLRDLGIPTIVWLCPILPFINDTMDNIKGILDDCIKANVQGILCFGMGVTLREGNREYFYQQLDTLFPGMKEKYQRIYGNQYSLTSPKHKELMAYFHKQCETHGILHDLTQIFSYLNEFEEKKSSQQLQLFI